MSSYAWIAIGCGIIAVVISLSALLSAKKAHKKNMKKRPEPYISMYYKGDVNYEKLVKLAKKTSPYPPASIKVFLKRKETRDSKKTSKLKENESDGSAIIKKRTKEHAGMYYTEQ